ncbi:oxidoreductase [Saccharopolyspora sp. TS4A08]|uniref:Oxidoreductase n=1 Tax=Saccharopolyspora ipomoeae TaxID=3042027 RepID=A0ABT6PTE7_9PSEU|nr:oxidoreductase [Saccharopolyspora sp. TS4A08]MDI2031278.1 oxidoreductase [Saccharopolyspora sp. TS4A08]
MPSGRVKENGSGPQTAAERRVDELLRSGRPDTPEGAPLDVHAEDHEADQEIRGEFLSRRLIESPDETSRRPFARRARQQPVILIQDAVISGCLNLRAAELPYLLEFVRCRFLHSPDVRQASMAGLVLRDCLLPGMQARNLRTTSDTHLLHCTSRGGVIDLADAELGGSLLLNDSELHHPGHRAIYADRLTVAGAMLGMRMSVAGEIRIPGAKIGGNLTLAGASLRNRGRLALNANGIQLGGSLRCDVDPNTGRSFTVAGLVFIPSATISGDLRMRDAVLEPGMSPPRRGESPYDDPTSTLIADRSHVHGDVVMDENFRSGGTIRMVSASIDGDLRLSGAQIDLTWAQSARAAVDRSLRAIHLDGTEIRGNLAAGRAEVWGEWRMTDVRVHGSFQLNRARLTGARTDVLQASRVTVGSNFDCREADVTGSVQLQGASVGANLDMRSTELTKPAWHRHKLAYKASVDLRGARIARDLVCASGVRPFVAEGEIQLRRAEVGRQANFHGARLGDGLSRNAINGFGMVTQELTLSVEEPPKGRILLRQAQCELLADNAALWEAGGGVDVDDFSYDNFTDSVEPTDVGKVQERLAWLRANSGDRYQPGPYDQLAKVFSNNGNEEHAVAVLIEKQRRRYKAIAASTRAAFRPPVRLWSFLQLITVSYGYRPLRALIWLVLLSAAGTTWFSMHGPLQPVNAEDHPHWSPLLYTVDQLVPIINLGHDVMWRTSGTSQWITVALIAAGWVLATTVAAGITRALRRDIQ